MKIKLLLLVTLLSFETLFSQNLIMQDSTLNNLVHPAGYASCFIGELGSVKKYGKGSSSMILVSGLGFGANVFDDFINHYQSQFSIFAVTPAGFGGTAAPAMPDTSVKYASLPWTNGIVTGILKLIEENKLQKPIIVAHFISGTQVALNLAMNHADKIGKVIIMGGSPYRYYGSPKANSPMDIDWDKERIYTNEQRSKITELYVAPKWFKTVTKKTWDSFMWTPEDYCTDTIVGKKLVKQSAEVPLQIMVRYMIEWGAYDPNNNYNTIKVPTLILIPDFKGILDRDPKDTLSCNRVSAKLYLKYYHQYPWHYAKESGNPLVKVQTIPGTRLFMWYDKPKETYLEIDHFIHQ